MRALKKAEDERESQKVKSKEIERLQDEIQDLVKLKNKLNKKVQNHNKYSTYLEKVGTTIQKILSLERR